MKYEYTYAELKNEMSVLENTFSIVRLVDPIICRVVHVTLQNDKLIFSPTSPAIRYGTGHSNAQTVFPHALSGPDRPAPNSNV